MTSHSRDRALFNIHARMEEQERRNERQVRAQAEAIADLKYQLAMERHNRELAQRKENDELFAMVSALISLGVADSHQAAKTQHG